MEPDISAEKYGATLDVLAELLPEHQFMRPVFDTQIQSMRAEIEHIGEEISRHIALLDNAEWKWFDDQPLLELRRSLEAQRSEIDDLKAALDAKLELSAPPTLSPDTMSLREPAELDASEEASPDIVNWKEGLYLASRALDECWRENDKLCTVVSSLWRELAALNTGLPQGQRAQKDGLQVLVLHMWTATREALPEESFLRSVFSKFIQKGSEDVLEQLVEGVLLISTLVPLSLTVLDSYREWRKEQVSMETAVKRVRALVAVRRMIVTWNSGAIRKKLLIERPDVDGRSFYGAIEDLREAVARLNATWEKTRSLTQSVLSANQISLLRE